MKTSELTGAALDWAVAKAHYTDGRIVRAEKNWRGTEGLVFVGNGLGTEQVFRFMPSDTWAQGGPIIERELLVLEVAADADADKRWRSNLTAPAGAMKYFSYGPTPLIAAMRCLVASKLGDEVDVPKELLP